MKSPFPRRSLGVIGGALLAVGLVPALVHVFVRPSVPAVHAQSPSGDSLLLQLAQRLLSQSLISTPTGLTSTSVQLLPGALPASLPIDLPLPPGSTLIGSDVRPSFQGASPVFVGPAFTGPAPLSSATQTPSGEHVDVVLDAPGSSDDVTNFYKNAMTALGWSQPARSGPAPGGFLPSSTLPAVTTFCETANGPWLNVSVRSTSGGPLDVRVTLDTGNAGACSPPVYPPGLVLPPQLGLGLLPSLFAPDGVTVRSTATSGANNAAGSSAIASTGMSIDALSAYYANQLQAAGWTSVDNATSPTLDWSTWSIPDHSDYQGFFYVRQGPADGQLSLHAEVASTDPNSSQIGAVSSFGVAAPSSAAANTTPTPIPTPAH